MTLLTTGAVISMLAGFVWWFVGISPPIRKLDDRLTELDHPKYGLMANHRHRLERLEGGWRTTIRGPK